MWMYYHHHANILNVHNYKLNIYIHELYEHNSRTHTNEIVLSPRHCHPAPIAVPLLPHLSHPFTVTGMCLSSFLCHGSNASLMMLMSPCICRGVSVLVSLSPCHSHGINPSSLSLHVAVLLSRCLCLPVIVTLSLSWSVSVISITVALPLSVFLSPCLSHPILKIN